MKVKNVALFEFFKTIFAGICLRNIQIGSSVAAVFWTHQRIFVVGRDEITEFHDSNDYKEQINRGKIWSQCHEGKIICASIRPPDAIVTTCSHGDIIFWSYETGHPYLRFNLKTPTCRMQIVYHHRNNKKVPQGNVKNNKNLFANEIHDGNVDGDFGNDDERFDMKNILFSLSCLCLKLILNAKFCFSFNFFNHDIKKDFISKCFER